jgi:hypothetical protein
MVKERKQQGANKGSGRKKTKKQNRIMTEKRGTKNRTLGKYTFELTTLTLSPTL